MGAGTLPAELEAWRQARARGLSRVEDRASPRPGPQPTDDNTLPSPLSPRGALDIADDAAASPPTRDTESAPPPRREPLDANAAGVQALAASAVDFLLSDIAPCPPVRVGARTPSLRQAESQPKRRPTHGATRRHKPNSLCGSRAAAGNLGLKASTCGDVVRRAVAA